MPTTWPPELTRKIVALETVYRFVGNGWPALTTADATPGRTRAATETSAARTIMRIANPPLAADAETLLDRASSCLPRTSGRHPERALTEQASIAVRAEARPDVPAIRPGGEFPLPAKVGPALAKLKARARRPGAQHLHPPAVELD